MPESLRDRLQQLRETAEKAASNDQWGMVISDPQVVVALVETAEAASDLAHADREKPETSYARFRDMDDALARLDDTLNHER